MLQSPRRKHPPRSKAGEHMKLDAKTIGALTALVIALSGAVEMRVQVGLLSSKVDRIEQRLDNMTRSAHYEP